jgi:Anticodon binding domain
MFSDANATIDAGSPPLNTFIASDVAAILHERGWLITKEAAPDGSPLGVWLARAAQLLGPQAATRGDLERMLSLVFAYEAASLLREQASHALLARSGAREVIRELANRVLAAGEIDSDTFKSLIDSLKEALPYRGPALFGPIRLALAGRIGDGELDRVILLLDSAATLDFATPVKGTRERILEFCAALD